MNETIIGKAFWEKRETLTRSMPRLTGMYRAIGKPTDFPIALWVQMMAFALEFKPDLILELGRGWGNSTCAFTEAAGLLGNCRVMSLCLSDDWRAKTLSKIRPFISDKWLEKLDAREGDVMDFNYKKLFEHYKRIVVFWDAHGYQIAGKVLGEMLPLLESKEHLILMHDMSDLRYLRKGSNLYKHGLWQGRTTFDGPRVILGHINSAVEQAVSVVDFTSRNQVPLNSAGHGLHLFFDAEPQKIREMENLLGEEACILQGDFFWFSLNGLKGPFTYPSTRDLVRPSVKAPNQNTPKPRIAMNSVTQRIEGAVRRWDLPEKKRVLKRQIRENARTFDRIFLGSFVYNKIYSTRKKETGKPQ